MKETPVCILCDWLISNSQRKMMSENSRYAHSTERGCQLTPAHAYKRRPVLHRLPRAAWPLLPYPPRHYHQICHAPTKDSLNALLICQSSDGEASPCHHALRNNKKGCFYLLDVKSNNIDCCTNKITLDVLMKTAPSLLKCYGVQLPQGCPLFNRLFAGQGQMTKSDHVHHKNRR